MVVLMGKYLSHFNVEANINVRRCAGDLRFTLVHPRSALPTSLCALTGRRVETAPQAPLPSCYTHCFWPIRGAGWRWVAGRSKEGWDIYIPDTPLRVLCVVCVMFNKARTPTRQTFPLGWVLVVLPFLDFSGLRVICVRSLDPWYYFVIALKPTYPLYISSL